MSYTYRKNNLEDQVKEIEKTLFSLPEHSEKKKKTEKLLADIRAFILQADSIRDNALHYSGTKTPRGCGSELKANWLRR